VSPRDTHPSRTDQDVPSEPTPTVDYIQSKLPLVHPETGNRIVALRQASSTVEFEAEIAPSESTTPQIEFAHIHPDQHQRVAVLKGTLRTRIGGSESGVTEPRTLQAGQTVTVPPQTPHRLWNDSDRPTRVWVEIQPDHGFAQFLYRQYSSGQQPDVEPEWTGDVLENAMTGERIRFCERAVDTDGSRLVYEQSVPPGTRLLDYHAGGVVHPIQTKYVAVDEGVLLARNYDDGLLTQLAVNDTVLYVPYLFGAGGGAKLAVKGARLAVDQRRRMTVPALAVLPGDEIVVQPGVPHQLWNPGPTATRLRIELQPALRFEQFIEMMVGLANDGLVYETGLPMSYRQWHVIAETYKSELELPKSKTLRSLVANVSKRIGKSQGYTAWDPAYSPSPERSAAARTVGIDSQKRQ